MLFASRLDLLPAMRLIARMAESVDILVLGHSHTQALKDFLDKHPVAGIKVLNLNTPDDGWVLDGVLQKGKFHPSIVEGMRPKAVFSMFGGNLHVTMGLIEDPVKFDFCAPDEPPTEFDTDRQYIPYTLLRETMTRNMRKGFLKSMAETRDHFGPPMFHLCSPPAFSDSQYIVDNPRGGFQELVKTRGVAPPEHRRRMHTLHSKIVEEWCAAEGVTFLPPPPEAVDAEGYLKRDYWHNDVSHANEAYGGLVVRQILETV